MIGCLTELTLTQRSRSNMLTPRNQLVDMLPKGSFTRDEWHHLIRLLKIMNFSMFSCSHFFLANRKQSAISKRGQEGASEEVLAMAKPRPMNLVMTKSRPMNFCVAQPLEYEEEFSAKCQSGTRRCFNQRLETDARHESKSSRVFSSETTGRHSNCRYLETGKEK